MENNTNTKEKVEVKGKRGRKPLTKENLETRIHIMDHAIDACGEFKLDDGNAREQMNAIKKRLFGLRDQWEKKLNEISSAD